MKNRFDALVVMLTAVVLTAFVGCGIHDANSGSPATLVSILVTPPNASIAPGTTAQLTATGTYSNGSTRNITATTTWSSSDINIITFNNASGPRGLATALVSIGTSTITAVSGGITGTTTLSTLHVQSMGVTPVSPASIAPGTTQQFAASGILTDGTTTQNLTSFATWTSLDPTIGMVSDVIASKGLATAVTAPGTATIRATFDSASGDATLTSAHVASIVVSAPTLTVPKGLTQQFTATGTLVDSATQNLTTWATWSTSNTAVATISNTASTKGIATAVAVGATNITALFDSMLSSAVTLTVTPATLQSIAITPSTSQSIALGLTQQYTATGTYTDGTHDITSSVIWTSSKTSVVSMSTSTAGLAQSIGQGTTTITANLSGKTASATLTVTPAELLSITISPASAVVFIPSSNTQQYTAQGTFTDGSRPIAATSLNWVSTNPDITINNTGLATDTIFTPATTNITANSGLIFSNTATLTFTF